MPRTSKGALRRLFRRPRWIAAAIVAVLALGLLVGGLVSWRYSDDVLVPDHSPGREDVRVESVGRHSVVLERSDETARPGYFGLEWPGGHAIAGPLLAGDDGTVTRRLGTVDGYLVPGTYVAVDSNVFAGNPAQARGLPFRTVRIPGELGPMPAWFVPGRRRATWAIFVHGINGTPQSGLRIAPALRRAGLPSLYITYREDLGAPSSPDGLHHMGLTEWKDVEATARYAIGHGARRLVLVGQSMGGAIVTQFAEKSHLAGRLSAIVLDAPVLDWRATLEFNATQIGLPGFLATPVEWAVGARIDADWDSLDALSHTEDFHLPILLFHGTEDEVVPIATSDEFAEALPRWVTYYRVPRAGHTQSWNVGPGLYDRRLLGFLETALKTKEGRPLGTGFLR